MKKAKEINGLKLGDWEVDLFPARGGRLGITVYRGKCDAPEHDHRPWADIYVEVVDGRLKIISR